VIRSLGRKVKNNPLLIGEAGVGKTAIVEGLVSLVVNEDVPVWLQGKSIYALDMNSLVSGTQMHGALQNKMTDLIEFASRDDVILFIDEIHMIVGAGAGYGSQMSVSNSLKQVLARGDISCIGATTHDEYQRYFAKDQALERRFLPIRIDEPSLNDTLTIVRGIKSDYEEFHDVEIIDDSLTAVVEFSDQYITDRFFPDKALDALDAALAHFKMTYDHAADSGEDMERVLTREVVADSLSKELGIPKDKMMQSRQEDLVNLTTWLQERIFGQDQAIQEISDTMHLANSGLKKSRRQEGEVLDSNENTPTAAMLFDGPTGVGKTELAKLLSVYLYNSNLVRLDMSEYSERHTVSKLTGAPPGYVGFDDGGLLTSAVRKQPYSVVLFDEIDKAHPAVTNILLQILSEGQLTDSKGNAVSFKNTVVILTSNSSSSGGGGQKKIGFNSNKSQTGKFDSKKINVNPNVLGRLDSIINFKPITTEAVDKILAKELKELNLNLKSKEVSVALSDAATEHLRNNALTPTLGARSVRNAFSDHITLVLAKKMVKNELQPGSYLIDFDGEDYHIISGGH
ncbi:MAG: ATP-dependent Clp protease ATP-binding subunit, partial [Pseudomonadota bacterium]|nr:ATP-dependent Clp protease ATP-binding subunit [Pseudomonadota bacterium]